MHSNCSDGDREPADVVRGAVDHDVAVVGLADHNGIWGVAEAQREAQRLGVRFVPGIEITSGIGGLQVHVLSYSYAFNEDVLRNGLRYTREGYEQRIKRMVELCAQNGYEHVSFEDIRARRSHLQDPSYISGDVAVELQNKYDMPREDARKFVTPGGLCYVPNEEWTLTPTEAVLLAHRAGGVGILAHPGILEHEAGREAMWDIIDDLVRAGLDGLEVYHPFHTQETMNELRSYCKQRNLLITGGSDWHGSYGNEDALGRSVIAEDEFVVLDERLRDSETARKLGS